uniref:Uncharacterized protein n=1 Tax=Moniliophthora roreri TaxID=221103 RepID=A0A0W0FQH6_MONRR
MAVIRHDLLQKYALKPFTYYLH